MKRIVLSFVLMCVTCHFPFASQAQDAKAGAPAVVAPQQKKRLAVFLDGTWNAVSSNTNVWRMKALTADKGKDNVPQRVYYEIGVNGFLGGTVGKGLDENIKQAYEWLIENYQDGDEVFILGFSRGAYTARSLAGLIMKHGILKPGSPIGVNEIYGRYAQSEERTIWDLFDLQKAGLLTDVTLQERLIMKYSQPVEIKMVGVWDTVGEVGIPAFSIEGISRSTFGFLETGLRVHLQNGYHALAIDEHRKNFAPTLWDVHRSSAKPRAIDSVEQRWFVGAHANVGGGYFSDLLAQLPLRWIMRKASLHGLAFRNDVDIDGNDGDVVSTKIKDSYAEFADGAYAKFNSRYFRPIGANPETRDDGTHTNVNESIDHSVFERWRASPEYRPLNLVEWAARKNVDPATIRNSVRADDPATAAPD